jgi:hypothetical protein
MTDQNINFLHFNVWSGYTSPGLKPFSKDNFVCTKQQKYGDFCCIVETMVFLFANTGNP